MIYVITNQHFESYSEGISRGTVKQCLDYFIDKSEIGVDTETNGFDVFTNNLLTLQLGDENNQFVIDVSSVDLLLFKELLESKLLLLHNAKFDLRFLYHHGILPYNNIFDTYLAERTLSLGIDSHRKSLGACVERYLKVHLAKEVRGLIHKLGIFNERVIRYSADDVKYLIPLKKAQERVLQEYNLGTALNLDNKFVCVLAYIEYCGVYLDKQGWVNKAHKDKELMDQRYEALNRFVIENFKGTKYVEEPNLFDSNFSCKINWNSPQQVIPLFEELGLDLEVFEKGKVKKSLDSHNLEIQKSVHPIVPVFLEFQKAKKLVSTYGLDFLKHINPKTNRIHTNFTQLMNTGRLSSGKDKETDNTKIGDVNMQNIPAGKERTYFRAKPSNVCIIADYSGQETRVLAELAQDPEYTDYISNPEKDLHCLMASFIYPELEGLTHKFIKENYKDKRNYIKPGTFSIPYGGDGSTIAANLSLPKEVGDRAYTKFMETFPNLKIYFEKAKEQVLRDGYVLINTVSNRKSFVTNFEQFKAKAKKMNRTFWEMYREEKLKESELFNQELKPYVSEYFKKKGSIERMGLNFPVQGSSADMSKLAGIYLYQWILKERLWGTVKICVPLHDEYFLESPEDISEIVKIKLEESMIKAAKVFCKNIPFKVESTISDHWTH